MRRPPNDAHFDTQKCGPLFVIFRVIDYRDYGEEELVVEWWICADNEDKAEERALYGSDRDIRGQPEDINILIDRAMEKARASAKSLARQILEWADNDEKTTEASSGTP